MIDYEDTEVVELLQGVLPLTATLVVVAVVLALAVAALRYYTSADAEPKRRADLLSRCGNTLGIGAACLLLVGGAGTALSDAVLSGSDGTSVDSFLTTSAGTSSASGSSSLTADSEGWSASGGQALSGAESQAAAGGSGAVSAVTGVLAGTEAAEGYDEDVYETEIAPQTTNTAANSAALWAQIYTYLDDAGVDSYEDLTAYKKSNPIAYNMLFTALVTFGVTDLEDPLLWDADLRAALVGG